jgi:uncharacterized membrane protein
MEQIREWIELAAQGIETLAVAIMVCFIIIGTTRWVFHSVNKIAGGYERYRVVMGKTLLVGLELLGALVVVRTFLGWSIVVEIEGRWPWQKAKESEPGTGGETTKETAA